ncbi:MAG TPA: hypothetical protein PLV93_14530, partial [Microthrixaceae bacterium]|nr:hypothetical protein [Microthrixaceae bacterium]
MTESTLGPAFTVKTEAVVVPVSGLVTVTLREPVVAVVPIVMFARRRVADTKVVEFTVMPVPGNVTAAPFTKWLPSTSTTWLVAPWPRFEGLVLETTGLGLTVKALFAVTEPESPVFWIVMFRRPVAAVSPIETLTVSCVELFTVTLLTVTPEPLNDTAAGSTKLVPVMTTFWLVVPCGRELGATDPNVGAPTTAN